MLPRLTGLSRLSHGVKHALRAPRVAASATRVVVAHGAAGVTSRPHARRNFAETSLHDSSLSAEENLAAVLRRLDDGRGAALPPAPPLGGLYVPVVRTGNFVYVSGQPPLDQDGKLITGICRGADDVDEAKEAAMWNGLTMLATLKVTGRVRCCGVLCGCHHVSLGPYLLAGQH